MTLKKFRLNLNPNKVHRNDLISICMLQICGKSISELPEIICKSFFKKGCFFFECETTAKKLLSNIAIAYFWKYFRKITL